MAFTREAGEIRFTRDERGVWSGTVTVWDVRATALSNIPAAGTAYGGAEPWAAATLRSVEFTESPNGQRGLLTYTYSAETVATSSEPQADPETAMASGTSFYNLRESGFEVNIELHPDYKKAWNHMLVLRDTVVQGSQPALDAIAEFEAATKASMPAHPEYTKWVRLGESFEGTDSSGYSWFIRWMPAKPAVDTYIVPGPLVVESIYYDTVAEATARASVFKRGYLVDDSIFPTYGHTDLEWLIMETTIVPDGKRFLVESSYQGDRSWDADIYPTIVVPVP